jgi:hypothetical protein
MEARVRRYGIFAGIIASCFFTTAASSAPMTYGCDTPADRYSAIEQNVELKSFFIKTNIQPNEFRKGKYAPLAQIFLESMDEKSRWALQVVAPDHKSKTALVSLKMTVDGKTDEPFFVGHVNIGQRLPIAMSVTDGHKISFTIGELEGHPELKLGNQAKLNIICSTGDFVFSDLEWGSK